jgi:serine/threonine protein kinase
LPARLDGYPTGLDELIWNSTRADLKHRSQIDNFVDDLDEVLAGIVGERAVNLAEDALAAHKGDQLRDDETKQLFTVDTRLGSGASAIAYRVTDDGGRVFVLKVARAPEHDDTLRAEFDALTKLRDRHIVQVHRRCDIDGHVAILMEDAGECLAARLRSNGPAHYDMLWRLGEDLLHAVDYLESVGVFHRDIKPDNCGIGEAKGTRKQTLVLFDFSLTNTAPTKVNVGTRQYLDPFLPERRVPRYDTHAERYTAALSLYEMATGRLPAWGDGLTDPRYDKDAVLHLATDRFPANIREQLDGFFRKAFHRNPEARFDNARDMLRAWSTIFEEAAKKSSSHHTVLREEDITLDSPIIAIGLSPSSANVLDRLDVTTVHKLLKLRLGDLRGTKGITHRTKIEIRDAKKKWATLFPGILEQDLPSMPAGGVTQLSTAANGPLGEFSIDHCIERLLDQDEDDSKAQLYKKALLGLGDIPAEPAAIWPSQVAVGAHYKVSRQAVGQLWAKMCGRWKTKSGTVTGLRDAIADILALQSGVVTAIELADALLAQRGCRDQDTATRRRKALAVIKAAVDVENDFQDRRFVHFRGSHTQLIAFDGELGQYADQLGEAADALVPNGQPPASPAKAIERLRAVKAPGEAIIEDRRLLTLAAASSGSASLSPNRLELYRKGMGAVEALRLASGALAGLDAIPVRELHQRVRDRYPDAELLPDRPLLDRHVDDAELGLSWDSTAIPDPTFPEIAGAYCRRRNSHAPTASGFSLLSSTRGHGSRPTRTEEQDSIDACAARLRSSRESRGFLVIQCFDDWTVLAEAAVRATFPESTVIDVEAGLIAALRSTAERMRIPWSTITAADAARPGTNDAQNLRRVVKEALKTLTSQILASRSPVLLTNPGLIARYDLITTLTDLRDAAGTPNGPPGVWVLVPVGSFSAHPTIDGVAVPIIGSHQTMHLDKAWVAHHRKASVA